MPSKQLVSETAKTDNVQEKKTENNESETLRQTEMVQKAIMGRADAHRAFAIALASDAMKELVKEDSEAFSDLLGLAISDFNVRQIDVANMLELSTAAVGRWVGGKSHPRPYARGMVLQVLRSLVEKGLYDAGVALVPKSAHVRTKAKSKVLDTV